MKEDKKIETGLWVTGWCLIGAAILLYGGIKISKFPIEKYMMPCMVYTFTGFYCPGCGGTRAVNALLHGQIIRSFLYHPIVLYVAVIGGWFMVSQTIERLSRQKIKIAMRYRDCYLWIALAIVVIQYLVKIVIQIVTGTDFLANI